MLLSFIDKSVFASPGKVQTHADGFFPDKRVHLEGDKGFVSLLLLDNPYVLKDQAIKTKVIC